MKLRFQKPASRKANNHTAPGVADCRHHRHGHHQQHHQHQHHHHHHHHHHLQYCLGHLDHHHHHHHHHRHDDDDHDDDGDGDADADADDAADDDYEDVPHRWHAQMLCQHVGTCCNLVCISSSHSSSKSLACDCDRL